MSKIKLFVNNPEMWTAFTEVVTDIIKDEYNSMGRLDDQKDIYRSQGKVMAYKKLLQLRDKVNGDKTP